MKPIHRIPIKAFPNNAAMIKVEIEQSQNCFINAFLIKFRRRLLFLFHFRTHARFVDEVAMMKSASRGFQDAVPPVHGLRGFGRKQDAVRHSAAFHGIAEQCDLIVIPGMNVRSKLTALLRMGSHCRILRPVVRSVRRSSAVNCTPLSLVRYSSSVQQ